ncbi:ATP-binding protein [Streptomyces sp. NPDC127098]|uniref:ATP-binding protein n=1 Tax=Streptomyces sp. NPDC127098 TaxID=3347137 RepID=UPI0036667BDD
MRFGVLGPLAVWTDEGAPVTVPDAKVRALLADLLAHEGAPVSVDRLVADLWGDRPPRNPTGTLQARVSQLRGALAGAEAGGRALVARGPAGYALRATPGSVDADRFAALLAAASAAPGPASRVASLDEALGLWRGPAFAEYADAAFSRPVVARLDEQRLTAWELRAEARLDLGEYDAVSGELAGLVVAHPLRERLRAAQLRALWLAGRQDAALAVFEEVRRGLAEELGVDPGPELAALHAAILRQDLPRRAAPTARSHPRLPARLTELVGRDGAVVEVAALLGACRLVTLTGTGGVGKTRLALAVAERAAASAAFPDGVWLVELAALGPAEVPDAVAAALGVRDDAPGGPDLTARLAEALRDRRGLLVLDNCEHLPGAVAELVHRLLSAAPGLRVLATSREPLALDGERLFAVEPLDLPDAVRLFAVRAAAAAPGFRLDGVDREAVAAICRRLDGLPLALELAATRVRAFGVRELAGLLDDRFRLLSAGARDAPARQRTLRAVIDWSWDLLDARERVLLRRLAVLADGCSREAVAEVCGGGVEELARLVDRSLVVADDGRFRLLESVAAYALERLREAGEEETVRDRHAAYQAGLAERAAPELRGGRQCEWLARLDAEAPGLRGALDWAAERGAAETALRLVNSLSWYWFLRGRGGEARRSLRLALAVPGRAPAVARAVAGAWLAGMTAEDPGEGALGGFAGLDEPLTLAHAEWFLALSHWAVGEKSEHGARVERALGTFRRLGDRWGEAAALSTRARLAVGHADFAAMAADATASLELFTELGDGWGRLEAGSVLAMRAEIAGEYAEAAERLRDGLGAAEELGLWAEASFRLSGLGRLALLTGDPDGAEELLTRGWRLAVEHSDQWAEEFADVGLAMVARRRGRLAEAETRLRRWLDWLAGVGSISGRAFVLAQLGFVAELRGDHEAAGRLHLDGCAAAVASGDPRAVALAAEGLACVAAAAGRPRVAARLLGSAAAARRAAGAPLPAGERHDVERAERTIRAALGEPALRAELTAGAALSLREALATDTSWPGRDDTAGPG